MSATQEFEPGGYRFVPGVMQYSAGVAAAAGHGLERAVFRRVVPLAEGFRCIAAHLQSIGRPLTALCACELRSPVPFDETGFERFNRQYVEPLRAWGIVVNGVNPVARTNVCPEVTPPAEPGFHAFCYTVPAAGERSDFVVAGSGEAPEGRSNYRDHVIRPGDTSAAGLREKGRWVLREMERRMAALGVGWDAATTTQVYTVHDIHPLMRDELCARGAARAGVTWDFARPPVAGLDYEMDVRGVRAERVLD